MADKKIGESGEKWGGIPLQRNQPSMNKELVELPGNRGDMHRALMLKVCDRTWLFVLCVYIVCVYYIAF